MVNNWGAVILLGGNSKRMGTPKTHMCYKGKYFTEHLVDLVSQYNCQILLSVNSKQQQLDIKEIMQKQLIQYEKSNPISFLFDKFPIDGPLNGVTTGIEYALQNNLDYILTLSIDCPNISSQEIDILIEKYECHKSQITSFLFNDRWMIPTLNLLNIKDYRESWKFFIKYISTLIYPRLSALSRFAKNISLMELNGPSSQHSQFSNINTPKDFARLKEEKYSNLTVANAIIISPPRLFANQFDGGSNLQSLRRELDFWTIFPHCHHIKKDLNNFTENN